MHKHDRFLTDTLGNYVEYIPVCPETECGLGIPRETLHLVGNPDKPRLVATHTCQDYTETMTRWVSERITELEEEDLCGFIFKNKSPSCAIEGLKIDDEKGGASKNGAGIFARIFMAHFPLVPVADEARLYNPELRENFIERIFVYKRWRELLAEKKTRGNLTEFHTRHKLLILSHSPGLYRTMGKLVGEAESMSISERYDKYQDFLSQALKLKTTPGKNANVLQHMAGYFKKQLSSDEKQELAEAIGQYQQGNAPLIVPLTLINHYTRKYDQPYLKKQYYLQPHPAELLLRNHA
jgi:uncharacterized protein YbgA (DUF1722 family)/uncharacterized protein YbbK (DUF523 family)